ncbi:MAG: transposase, partial [Polyangiaceae bacterium]|nr:transposase [Polyangiaceae bacterium]
MAEEKAKSVGLIGADLKAHRQQHIGTIARDFSKWLAAVEPTLLPSEPLNAAAGYYRRHWSALTRFIDDPQAPIDNSATEREFQNVAKLRLNMLFAGSTRERIERACCWGSCRRAGPSECRCRVSHQQRRVARFLGLSGRSRSSAARDLERRRR